MKYITPLLDILLGVRSPQRWAGFVYKWCKGLEVFEAPEIWNTFIVFRPFTSKILKRNIHAGPEIIMFPKMSSNLEVNMC